MLTLLLAGCAENAASTRVPLLPPTVATTAISLPLDAYTAGPQEQERADRAQAFLERACLRRLGLSWPGPGEAQLLTGRAIVAGERATRFGLVDRAQASRYGYHEPPWSLAGAASEDRDGAGRPPADVAEVLVGQATTVNGLPVPQAGCRGEAARRLAAGMADPGDATLVTILRAEADQRALADSRITQLFERWSGCLAQDGYHYSTPMAAIRDPRWHRTEKPDGPEIRAATADVACKSKIAYLPTIAGVTADHQQALISANAEGLGRVRRSLEVREANAERVLAGQSTTPSPTLSTQMR